MSNLGANLNALARRYGRKKKRQYALKPAPVRPPVRGLLGQSTQSTATAP